MVLTSGHPSLRRNDQRREGIRFQIHHKSPESTPLPHLRRQRIPFQIHLHRDVAAISKPREEEDRYHAGPEGRGFRPAAYETAFDAGL